MAYLNHDTKLPKDEAIWLACDDVVAADMNKTYKAIEKVYTESWGDEKVPLRWLYSKLKVRGLPVSNRLVEVVQSTINEDRAPVAAEHDSQSTSPNSQAPKERAPLQKGAVLFRLVGYYYAQNPTMPGDELSAIVLKKFEQVTKNSPSPELREYMESFLKGVRTRDYLDLFE